MDINFDEIFKFKMGDVLMHRAMLSGPKSKYWLRHPRRYSVSGRVLEESPIGIELAYVLSAIDCDGEFVGVARVPEYDLVIYPSEFEK